MACSDLACALSGLGQGGDFTQSGKDGRGRDPLEWKRCHVTIAVEAEHSQLHFMHHDPRIVITKAKEALRESGLWSVLYKPQQS